MKKFLLPVIFGIIILAPALDVVFKISPSGNINENRVKASMPHISVVGTEKFPMAFENFFSDNFNLRSDLLILNAYIKFNILHLSPFKNTVMMGKDGWFFVQKYISVFQAKEYFDKEELYHFKRLFEIRAKWLSDRNIKMYLVVVPVSTSIYPEFLPSYMVSYKSVNKTDSLLSFISKVRGLKIIDLRASFKKEKTNGALRMYHKTDQHWNDYGAFIATKAIIDTIRKDFKNLRSVKLSDYKITSYETDGHSLAAILLKEKEIKEVNITATPVGGFKAVKAERKNYPLPTDFPYKEAFETHYVVKGLDAPKIMIMKDSYANNLSPYLNEYFRHSVYIWDNWAYRLNENIVESEKPDIVVFEVIEADLYNMIYGADSEINRDSIKRFRYTRDWMNDTSLIKKSPGAHDKF